MKIYTKSGDQGETSLFDGQRVSKDDLRVDAYGTVDELNAVLGMVRASGPPSEIDELLEGIQHELFRVGGELATRVPRAGGVDAIGEADIRALEAAVDRHQQRLPELKQFILPGGTLPAATLHLARTVCRRAERRVVSLLRCEDAADRGPILPYLNRLGDLLFVLARAANAAEQQADVVWSQRGSG